MPINNNLPDKKFPVAFKYGKDPVTEYKEHLNAIRVELIDAPTYQQLLSYIPSYALATWEDEPRNDYSYKEREKAVEDLFEGKVLPTALETIGLTFLISNIDLIDVTHLIRHRSMSFSAHCTGDRDQRNDPCLVKSSIIHSEFYDRFTELVHATKQLYADMVDSELISILDARTILPRALTNHYYARVNLRDFIGFLHQRLDRQIQPESDNIVALKMLVEADKRLPGIAKCIDLDKPDMWYVKTAQTDHSSNLYMPEIPRNDVFEYKAQWFMYKRQRSKMLGGYVFTRIWNNLTNQLKLQQKRREERLR